MVEIKLRNFIWLFFFILLTNGKQVWATNVQDQSSLINKVENKKIKLVLEYNYKVTRYAKPEKVEMLKKGGLNNLKSPLNTLKVYFSAMSAGDYDWFLSCWDQKSREDLIKKDLESGRNEKFWVDIWKKKMKDRVLYVEAEVRTGEYIFLKYRLSDVKGEKVSTNSIAFKLSEGKWFATSELAEDPVYNYWDVPELQTQTTVVR